MKLLTMFSAFLLLSTTGINTSIAFQQVGYAETESSSEVNKQSTDTMDSSTDPSDV
ncbi:hypothetical protein GVL14_16210, partial [Enterococcus mundtii]|nr:hypothetical protein [Enterococcus mundtii]